MHSIISTTPINTYPIMDFHTHPVLGSLACINATRQGMVQNRGVLDLVLKPHAKGWYRIEVSWFLY